MSATDRMENVNPTVYKTSNGYRSKASDFLNDDTFWDSDVSDASDDFSEDIDSNEIFDLIRSISDPEHPLTLEQLAVVSAPQVGIKNGRKPSVQIEFTPTIPHCSMATLIGLSLRVRLMRSLPERFKIDIKVKEGSHQSENAINKQLNDKERVAAALENEHLYGIVQQCLATADKRGNTE